MIRFLKTRTGILCFASVLILACQKPEEESSEEKSEFSIEKLSGHWELVEAKRDGKFTRVLDNTYFIFTKDSILTNFPSKEGRYSFQVIENEIVTEEQSPTFYKVHNIYQDTMEFSVNLQGYLFEVTLAAQPDQKKKEES
jgi:hypothetical protein